MILVDEFLAIQAISGAPPAALAGSAIALTYSRAYRLTRALMDAGPGRLRVRGRFTRLVDGLNQQDQRALQEWLTDPDPAVLTVPDPRPLIRTAAALQNTYAVSLLQAETLAAAATEDWPVRFADADGASPAVRRAAQDLGLNLAVITA